MTVSAVTDILDENKLTGLCVYSVYGGWVASIEIAGKWRDSKVCDDADEALRQVVTDKPVQAPPWAVQQEKMPWE